MINIYKNKDLLWLIVRRQEIKLEEVIPTLPSKQDPELNFVMPIQKSEVLELYLACREYLYGHGRKKEEECSGEPDCKCEECRTQRDFDNNGGADRW